MLSQSNKPPYSFTDKAIHLIVEISEMLDELGATIILMPVSFGIFATILPKYRVKWEYVIKNPKT